MRTFFDLSLIGNSIIKKIIGYFIAEINFDLYYYSIYVSK